MMPLLAIFIELHMSWAAFAVLVVAGITDYLDGHFARSMRQETTLGKLMDPVADKIFLCVTVIFLMSRFNHPDILDPDPTLSPWLAALLLAREFLVTGLRALAASVGVVIAANWVGKWKMMLQFIGLGFITLGGHADDFLPAFSRHPAYDIGFLALWTSVALSYWSMVSYSYRVYLEFKDPST